MKISNVLMMSAFLGTVSIAHAASSPYPNLEKLCDAAKKQGQHSVPLETVNFGASGVWALNMLCNYALPTQAFSGVSLQLMNEVLSGDTYNTQVISGNARVQQMSTNGKPEIDIAFESSHFKFVTRAFLNVNSAGQPQFAVDRFDATLDPAQVAAPGQDPSAYNSGTFVELDSTALGQICGLSDISNGIDLDCSDTSKGSSQSYLINDMNNVDEFVQSLTWPSPISPTDTHLNPDGALRFQESLKELAAAVSNGTISSAIVNGKISDADFQAVMKSASESLKNLGSSND